MPRSIVIDRQFRGPPESGNGGYCCGLLAAGISGPVEVTLFRPPPLGRPLSVIVDESARLIDGEVTIAEGRATDLALEVPAAPTIDQARRWSRAYAGFRHHVFPECFVCGPARGSGDGLRIFAGPSPDEDRVAALWRPDRSLVAADDLVAAPFLWAALDCPGYFAVADERPALLGRMTAAIDSRPPAGVTCIVMGWPLARDGRKLHAGTALFDEDGSLLARSMQTWILIDVDD